MSDSRPNIVFLLCDNVGWGDFSCYGGITPTPRIDALASEGIRFKNYIVEAQCTPTPRVPQLNASLVMRI
jgi:arylsulfatase